MLATVRVRALVGNKRHFCLHVGLGRVQRRDGLANGLGSSAVDIAVVAAVTVAENANGGANLFRAALQRLGGTCRSGVALCTDTFASAMIVRDARTVGSTAIARSTRVDLAAMACPVVVAHAPVPGRWRWNASAPIRDGVVCAARRV